MRYRAEVREFLLRKRQDLAMGALNKILSLAPHDPEANRQLASCLLALHRLDEAVIQGKAAVALNPHSPAPFITLGAIHAVRYEHAQAIPLFEEAMRLKPEYIPAYVGLADCCTLLDRPQEALDWATKGLAFDPTRPTLLRIRATSLATLNRPDEALAVMEEFLRVDPDSAASQSAAGTILARMGRNDDAAEHHLRALAINPVNPETHKVLGFLRLKQDRLDEARHHFNQALSLQPDMRPAINGLKEAEIRPLWKRAVELVRSEQFEQSEKPLRQILAIDPGHGMATTELARALLVLRRYDEALVLANESVRIRPKAPHPHFVLGLVLAATEQDDAAMIEARQAIALGPKRALYYRLPPLIHLELDRHEEALSEIEKALAMAPDDPGLLRSRGIALAGLGRREEALATAQNIPHEPKNPWAGHLAAGRIYMLLKQYDEAESSFRRAMELAPDRLSCKAAMGVLLFEMGRFTDARPLLEEALRLDRHERRVRKALAEMNARSE